MLNLLARRIPPPPNGVFRHPLIHWRVTLLSENFSILYIMPQKAQTNRKFKDSVFTKLFGEKNNLIELYNAISLEPRLAE